MLDFPKPEMIQVGEVELEVFQAGQGGIPGSTGTWLAGTCFQLGVTRSLRS